MTDKEHADKIRFLVHELNHAMSLATENNIKVLLDVQEMRQLSTPHAYPVVTADIMKVI